MSKLKKEKKSNLSTDDNNEQIQNVNPPLQRSKSFFKKSKKVLVNNLPIITAIAGTGLAVAGASIDGLQYSDIGNIVSVAASSGVVGSLFRGTIKSKKQEKQQKLIEESEDSIEIDELQKELLKAQLRAEISFANLKAEQSEFKIQKARMQRRNLNNSSFNTASLFTTKSSFQADQSDSWSQIINSSTDSAFSSINPVFKNVSL